MIKELHCCITTELLIKALWLDAASPMTWFNKSECLIRVYISIVLKLDKQTCSHLVVEVCIQWGTSPPPSPLPHLLQDMAGRRCQRFVLTIDVYKRARYTIDQLEICFHFCWESVCHVMAARDFVTGRQYSLKVKCLSLDDSSLKSKWKTRKFIVIQKRVNPKVNNVRYGT